MLIAGTVNLCILLLAAANLAGVPGTDTLEGAYAALGVGLGPLVATLFAVGLLASGLASTSVGAYAGAEIMHGLLHIRVPLIARRLVTLIPALVILALGVDPTLALVLSQVVLSFGIPFALIPLVVAHRASARCSARVRNRVGDDGRRDRGIRLPHRAQRRPALARAHRRMTRPATGGPRTRGTRNRGRWGTAPGAGTESCGTRGGRLRPGSALARQRRETGQSVKAPLQVETAPSAIECHAVGTATTEASPVTSTLPFGAVTSSPST